MREASDIPFSEEPRRWARLRLLKRPHDQRTEHAVHCAAPRPQWKLQNSSSPVPLRAVLSTPSQNSLEATVVQYGLKHEVVNATGDGTEGFSASR